MRHLREARSVAGILALLAVCAVAIFGASRRTSSTFDEIPLLVGGARGLETGRFDVVTDHPVLMQVCSGSLPYLAGFRAPPPTPDELPLHTFRYMYAQRALWMSGYDGHAMVLLARIPYILLSLILVALVFLYALPRFGMAPAFVAAGLVGFLPDLLAHGGIAYNDVPFALGYFATLWAAESTLRRPSVRRGVVAGAVLAAAIGLKYGAIVAVPAAAAIAGLEAWERRSEREWRRAAACAFLAAGAALYLGLLLQCRGEFTLSEIRTGISEITRHSTLGHIAPAYLLGRTSEQGWWYYFPTAFLFKTPVAYQMLLVLSAGGGIRLLRDRANRSTVRLPLAGVLTYLAVLLTSHLNVGFRHALPLFPPLALLAAAGLRELRHGARAWTPVLTIGLLLWFAGSSLSWYPYFLSFTSEYVGSRDAGDRVLLDSNLDWGQGLLELKSYLRREHIESVYLSYFGSAPPEAYGIAYVPLPSFFPLQPQTPPALQPAIAVISATHLHGLYLDDDPLRMFRGRRPLRVLAHSLFVFPLDAAEMSGARGGG